jgi:hypothetical protein
MSAGNSVSEPFPYEATQNFWHLRHSIDCAGFMLKCTFHYYITKAIKFSARYKNCNNYFCQLLAFSFDQSILTQNPITRIIQYFWPLAYHAQSLYHRWFIFLFVAAMNYWGTQDFYIMLCCCAFEFQQVDCCQQPHRNVPGKRRLSKYAQQSRLPRTCPGRCHSIGVSTWRIGGVPHVSTRHSFDAVGEAGSRHVPRGFQRMGVHDNALLGRGRRGHLEAGGLQWC